MFIFVCVPTCVQCTHTRALCMRRPGDNIRCCSSAYGFVESRSFTDLKLTSRLGWLPVSSKGLLVFASSPCWDYKRIPQYLTVYVGSGGSDSAPHSCQARIFTTLAISLAQYL